MKNLISVLCLFVSGIASAATVVPDQSTVPYIVRSAGYFVGLNYAMTQTFTVGVAGQLATVQVAVGERPNTATDLVFSIWNTRPDGFRDTMLFSESIPVGTINAPTYSYDWLEFDVLSAGIGVNTGDVFAITLQAPGASLAGEDGYYWATTDIGRQVPQNDYTGGESYLCYNFDPVLGCEQRFHDYVFTTSVQLVPLPAAAWLFGSALFGLGWARRKE